MIHPHVTTPRAQTMGSYTPAEWQRYGPKREARYCPCGTKLRSTKPLHRTQCDTCEDQTGYTPTPGELHPHTMGTHSRYRVCPTCDGPMHRGSKQCRWCSRNPKTRLA